MFGSLSLYFEFLNQWYSTRGFYRCKCVLQLETLPFYSMGSWLGEADTPCFTLHLIPMCPCYFQSQKGTSSSLHTGKGPDERMVLKLRVPGPVASRWSVGWD